MNIGWTAFYIWKTRLIQRRKDTDSSEEEARDSNSTIPIFYAVSFFFFLISIKLTFPCYSKIQPYRPPELKQKFSLLQLVFIYPRQCFDIQIRRKKALSTLWVIFKVLGHALNILDSFMTTPVKLDFVTPGLVYGRQDVNWLFNMSAGTGQACMKFK